LVVIDFIDMMDPKHNADVEKAFKRAIDLDRARIQLSHISKFGLMELSRQKKQSTIQEISYSPCPYCRGRGARPSLEYTALNAYRKIETQAVKGFASHIRLGLPQEVAEYLQNHKRTEISHLESEYDVTIQITGGHDLGWEEYRIETARREAPPLPMAEAANLSRLPEKPEEMGPAEEPGKEVPKAQAAPSPHQAPVVTDEAAPERTSGKKPRRRSRHRRKKPVETASAAAPADPQERTGVTVPGAERAAPPPHEPDRIMILPDREALPPSPPLPPPTPGEKEDGKPANSEALLTKLRKVFEALGNN
ncbi:MAG: ribonuclease E/G, partial [Syntrophaceae bacterium]|nr:ribonuclease E/G [Syntrophaceae bacterium]